MSNLLGDLPVEKFFFTICSKESLVVICIIYASYDYSNRSNPESYLDPTSLAVCKNYLAKTNGLKVKKNLESMQYSSKMRDVIQNLYGGSDQIYSDWTIEDIKRLVNSVKSKTSNSFFESMRLEPPSVNKSIEESL